MRRHQDRALAEETIAHRGNMQALSLSHRYRVVRSWIASPTTPLINRRAHKPQATSHKPALTTDKRAAACRLLAPLCNQLLFLATHAMLSLLCAAGRARAPKRYFWRPKCYRLSIRHFWQDLFRTIPPNMSLEPVLAGFGITSAVEKALGFPAAAARSKMTFAVGRIRKCTLKLKLLVFLFCSPEVRHRAIISC